MKKGAKRNIGKTGFVFTVFLLSCVAPVGLSQISSGSGPVSLDLLNNIIRDEFGRKLKVDNKNQIYYLNGDFNGDGFPDIAVLVNVEEGREELKGRRVKYIDVNPWEGRNGLERNPVSDMGRNCLGIAVIHGAKAGWTTPVAKYIFYECFSDFRLIRKGQKIPRGVASRGPAPIPIGDSIRLSLESGATMLVYWNGKTYRGFGQRGGD
jgi:hypothetical protein